jgi:aminopeptidase N
MEFPRYADFAQSFANTIPFSEGIGFTLKVDKPGRDLDMVYYVTAHEVAHQWWGHQVTEAGVKGSGMLSEGMSQYSALMVMKQKFPPEHIEKYLKYELDAYLAGRARERKKESTLKDVEGQTYIQYNKASLVFYALQDYIGEENVNNAFRNYIERWGFKEGSYPSSEDLLEDIRAVTPDSLQSVVHDLFETITLYENKAVRALYERNSDGTYDITFTFSSGKVRADSAGVEHKAPLKDWIDIGIYTNRASGAEELVYLKKHFVSKEKNVLTIKVREKPSRAGVDPLHKLIDRHSDDNSIVVTEIVEMNNILVE